MKQYSYEWFHVPSGKRGFNTVNCTSIGEFSDKIHQWNKQGAGIWEYRATITIGG